MNGFKHGKSNDPIYGVWKNMKGRCFNEKDHNYKNYGARGISVCEEWLNPETFFKWASENGYRRGLSLDRIDNNGNYSPENCRWADNVEQGRNRRTNVIIEYKGQSKSIADWAEETGIGYTTLVERHRNGWTPQEMMETPKRVYVRKKITPGDKGDRFVSFSLFVNPEILATSQQKKVSFRQRRIYTDSRVLRGMKLVEKAARPHRDEVLKVCPLGTDVSLKVVFLCEFPKGTPKSMRIDRSVMTGRFDCDNKYKSVGDALTNAGFWTDDRYVTALSIEKRRTTGTPRIEIVVEPDQIHDLDLVNDEEIRPCHDGEALFYEV